MAYNYQYINKHTQFNANHYTLVLTDAENVMPDVRIEKRFCLHKYTNQNEQFLHDQAQYDITLYTQQYIDEQVEE